ncbi:MAG: hypothetical protein HQ567_14575 [Candidatus Nealsonbacteria bacterium]|nr:hypothetical protein [Candidatus Nealsonbacteria bacterium]
MWRKHRIVWPAVMAVGLLGCGGSDQGDAKSSAKADPKANVPQDKSPLYVGNSRGSCSADKDAMAKLDGPAAAVAQFLTSLCRGEDENTRLMLTNKAREVADRVGLIFAPSGSDTALFEIHEVKYIDDNGAQVVCASSDLDRDLERQVKKSAWVVRREAQGWRIAGVSTAATPGKAALTMNFEDPQDMAARVPKPRSAATQPNPQAQRPGPPGGPIRK